MEVWVIALLVIVGMLALLFVGGVVANARLHAREDEQHARRIADADHALADARAEDRGWNRATLEEAARAAFEARGEAVTALELVQVVDRPGTDQDRARFRARTAEGFVEIELARMGDSWEPAQ